MVKVCAREAQLTRLVCSVSLCVVRWQVFERYDKLNPNSVHSAYAGHGWEEGEARQLAAALEYAAQKAKLPPTARPIVLNLEGNHFGETGRRLIRRAVQFGRVFAPDVRF